MLLRTVVPALLLLACTESALAARLALVVGLDNYQSVTRLRNARADAESIGEALRRSGWRVEVQLDRTLKQLQGDLRAFRQRVSGGDEVVFFFSGHGVQIGGVNYLLPIDVTAESEEQVRDDAVSLAQVLGDFRERKPRFTLVILDACRDNPFVNAGRSIGGRGLAGVTGASGQMIIYAAGDGQRALDRLGNDDQSRNGLFTRVFLREMAKPGASIRDVLFRVRDEVATLAESVRHEQVPAVYDQVRGNYYFAPWERPSANAESEPSTPSSPPAQTVPNASRSQVGDLTTSIAFSTGDWSLSSAALTDLQGIADHIKRINLRVVIATGYADPTERNAMDVSKARAESVKAALVRLGVDRDYVYAEGKGVSPAAPRGTAFAGRSGGARVDLEIAGLPATK